MKICKYCFEPLVRRDGEKKQNFDNRKHCDRICAGKDEVEREKKKHKNTLSNIILTKSPIIPY